MNTKGKSKKDKNEAPCIEIRTLEVKNVRVVGKDDYVFMTLVINGVTVNNCSVKQTKDGEDFVSFPSYKGSDGKWYSTVYCKLSDEDSTKILEEVQKQIDEM